MNRRLYACVFSTLLLTACTSSLAPVPLEPSPQPSSSAHHLTAAELSSWQISGAVAAKNKNKGWAASLNWEQDGPNHYHMRLSGPIGSGTVLIEKNKGVVTFTDGIKHSSAPSADTLLQQQTGVSLPVQNLYYWVRGLPGPGGVSASQHDTNGHLLSFNQAGYHIQYLGYTDVHGTQLPRNITVQGHDVLIKLVIQQWNVKSR